jgi:hypothetical protein
MAVALSSSGEDGLTNRFLNTDRTVADASGSIGEVFATFVVAPANFGIMSITSAGRGNANVQEWLGVAPAELNAGRVQTFQSGNVIGSIIGDVSGTVGSVQGASVVTFTSGQADDIAERVWDLPRIRATTSGTFGQSVNVQNGVAGNVTGSVASVAGAVGSVTGGVGGDITGKVLGGVSGEVGLQIASIKTTTFVAGAINAAAGAADFYAAIADGYLDRSDGIESGMTPRQAQRGIAAAAMGLLSGAGTPNIGIRQAGTGTATRISAVVDQSGNRSTVTRNL